MPLENYCQYYRQKAQLRQHEVADALGMTQQQVSQLETHPLQTDLGKLLAYAQVLDVPLVVLLPCVAQRGARLPPREDGVCLTLQPT